MSQHTFPVREDVYCMVGWDPPLGTFFAHVYKADADGNHLDEEDPRYEKILWIGCTPNEIVQVDELARQLHPYTKLPRDIFNALYAIEIN